MPNYLTSIATDGIYVYAGTVSGLEVYKDDVLVCTHSTLGRVNTVSVGAKLYIGTNDGLYTKTLDGCLSAPERFNRNLTATNITYIHTNRNHILISTISGVDYFRLDTNPEIHSKTTVSGAGKCFITEDGGYYFTSVSGIDHLNVIKTMLCDWGTPTKKNTVATVVSLELDLFNRFIYI